MQSAASMRTFLLFSLAATTALRLGAAPTVRAAATKNCAAQMGANKGALLFDLSLIHI